MHSINDRESEIAKIAESKEGRAALEKHLEEIIEGVGFKGSHRSGQFLRYIVEQAVAGRLDSLKERVIGMELFGRSPSYDTGEDAIVRVTASDVRKRLLQHYGSCERPPEFRISLPLGSYFPEITREIHGDMHSPEVQRTNHDLSAASPSSAAAPHESVVHSSDLQEQVVIVPAVAGGASARANNRSRLRWLSIAILLFALSLSVLGIVWKRTSRPEAAQVSILPWSLLFSSPHPIHLITSDPDIASIQRIAGNRISVSDYANHNYIPDDNRLSPEVKLICQTMMRGDKAATLDTQIAVKIAELAQSNSKKIDVQGARSIQFSNLKTDDNFIFLGSPMSDPWFALFNDQLDFRIVTDKDSGEELIRNVHPGQNEQSTYVPTARGGATGQSFAVIAFVQNPDQNGQVLLLAGINAEGTQAAGKLVTDLPRLSATLKTCGIPPTSPLKHFQVLLRVKTMAGSPSEFGVVACHILTGTSPQGI
jgi:hypothetical protein